MTYQELTNDVCIDIRNMAVFLGNIDINVENIAKTLKMMTELLEITRKNLLEIENTIRQNNR